MATRRRKFFSTPLVLVGLALPLVASCEHPTLTVVTAHAPVPEGAGGLTCDELRTGDLTAIPVATAPAIATGLRNLLSASMTVAHSSVQFEKELISACAELGAAAGGKDADLQAAPDHGHGAEKVCTAGATAAAAMMQQIKDYGVQVSVEFKAPRCYTDIEAARTCLAKCGSPASSTDDKTACAEGELSGRCLGRCQGICTKQPGVGVGICVATCAGKCDHDFRGTCDGQCEGTCGGTPIHGKGRCVGICDGSCTDRGEGVCAGTCEGSCSGVWEQRDPAQCSGECEGGCTGGPLAAMHCSGEFLPKGIDLGCQGSCAAASALAARCEAPPVRVVPKGGRVTPDMERFFVALQASLPKILRLQVGTGKKLHRGMHGAVGSSVDWTNAYPTAGAKALFCVHSTMVALKEAETSIDVAIKGSSGILTAVKAEGLPAAHGDDQ